MHRGSTTNDATLRHLVVIAGPSCVGKSTLAERLMQGELPALAQTLGLTDAADFALVHAAELKGAARAPQITARKVIFHYELTRTRFITGGARNDHALNILQRAERVDLLTLWEHPETMRKRFRQKVRRTFLEALRGMQVRRAWNVFRRFRVRRRYFVEPTQMWELYRQWFDLCDTLPVGEHWTLCPSQSGAQPRRLGSRANAFWDDSVN